MPALDNWAPDTSLFLKEAPVKLYVSKSARNVLRLEADRKRLRQRFVCIAAWADKNSPRELLGELEREAEAKILAPEARTSSANLTRPSASAGSELLKRPPAISKLRSIFGVMANPNPPPRRARRAR